MGSKGGGHAVPIWLRPKMDQILEEMAQSTILTAKMRTPARGKVHTWPPTAMAHPAPWPSPWPYGTVVQAKTDNTDPGINIRAGDRHMVIGPDEGGWTMTIALDGNKTIYHHAGVSWQEWEEVPD